MPTHPHHWPLIALLAVLFRAALQILDVLSQNDKTDLK
jgi:hypothetical protein